MEDSVTYQAIIAKGRAEGERQGAVREARKTLLLQGEDRFGPPDAETAAAVEALDDLARLEQLSVALLHAQSWPELLQTPSPRAPRSRRKGKRS